jgi:two-component system chemotaxis sensor kinase CheA
MDIRRLTELFAAEAAAHLRLLNKGILGLESERVASSLEEAFRAVHTIKGLAATMSYRRVTALSHELEDTLVELRSGSRAVNTGVVDELLTRADALEAAVAAALSGADQAREARVDGGVRVARVQLGADTPLKAARAMLVVRAAQRAGILEAHEPAAFGEDFEGDIVLRLVRGADEAAAEAAIRSAGEVTAVVFESAAAPEASPAPAAEGGAFHKVRVDRRRLDDVAGGIGELSVLHARLEAGLTNGGGGEALHRMGGLLAELQQTIMAIRMVPLSEVFDRLPRVVRDAARALDKDAELHIEGGGVEVDRAIAEELRDPLVHLLRNAVDHGLETRAEREAAGKAPAGRLELRVMRERNSVRVEVCDDGRGIRVDRVVARAREIGLLAEQAPDAVPTEEVLRLISSPGFSTAERVTELSGRGVGLDAVVNRVRALGGAIDLTTESGAGTTFTLRVPVTLAIAQALLVRVGGEEYAVPLTHVREALELDGVMLVGVAGRESVRVRDDLLPLIRLRRVLQISGGGEEGAALVAEVGERRAAVAVDKLVAREQILVKPFDAPVGTLPVFSGATLLADGRPALILDPSSVL